MAGKSAGSIIVDLLLNDAKFKDGISSVTKGIQKFGSVATDTALLVGSAFVTAGSALGTMALVQMNLIQETNKLAKATGIAIGEFQAISLVAREASINEQALVDIFTTSQKAVLSATKGLNEYASAFAGLDLNVSDLIKLSPEEQFQQIAEALAEIENPTVRAGYAMKLFGENGKYALSILDGYAKKVEEAREFNDRFNVTLTEADAEKIEEVGNAFARLRDIIEGFRTTLAVDLAPILTALIEGFIDSSKGAQSFTDIVQQGVEIAAAGIDILRRAVAGVSYTFYEFIEILSGALAGATKSLYQFGEAVSTVFNILPGDPIEAEDAFLRISQAAKKMQEDAAASSASVIADLRNFETTADKIARIQDEATYRNSRKIAGSSGGNDILNLPDLKKAKKEQDEYARILERNRGVITGLDKATLDYNDTLKDLDVLLKAGKISQEEYNGAIIRAQSEFEKAQNKGKLFFYDMEEFSKEASRDLQNAFSDFFKSTDKGFDELLLSFVDMLHEMVANALANNLAQAIFGGDQGLKQSQKNIGDLFNLFGGSSNTTQLSNGNVITWDDSGGIGDWFSGLFDGFFANGGTIGPGRWGIAGEAGPEMVFGGMSGATVVPNGGGGSVNVNIINNTNSQISQSSSKDGNNTNLEIMINEAVSKSIGTRGSPINKALNARDNRTLVRR